MKTSNDIGVKSMAKKKIISLPTKGQLEEELKREKYRHRYFYVLRNTIYMLITVSAISVLIATLFLPVLQIYGNSMTPTLTEGEIVLSLKGSDFEQGDIIAFYYNNKILVKRVIAVSGEWVEIDNQGNVSVNGEPLDEPYLTDKAMGECDLTFPYQIPEGRCFVMGDHRSTSVDSRSSTIGCIAEEEIVGKIVFTIWPLNHFGQIS